MKFPVASRCRSDSESILQCTRVQGVFRADQTMYTEVITV